MLYKDGVLASQSVANYTDVISPSPTTVTMGYYSTSATYFNGSIDEARVYNRTLNADEITALYNYAPPAVAHWKFDEGTGTTASDFSGNGNNGTLTNGPVWTSGIYSSSLFIDAVNDYVTVPDNNLLDIGIQNMTISSWIKMSDISNTRVVVQKIDNSGAGALAGRNGYAFFYGGTGALFFKIYGNSSVAQYSSNPITLITNKWYHIAMTANRSGNVTYYLDGNLLGTASISGFNNVSLSNTDPLTIGNNSGLGTPIYSDLDDMRIYNYSMTQTQIQKVMNNDI